MGWKTLIHWGLFTIASIQPTASTYSEALPAANKMFLKINPNPISRKFQELARDNNDYAEAITKMCQTVLQQLLADYPLAFAENIAPG